MRCSILLNKAFGALCILCLGAGSLACSHKGKNLDEGCDNTRNFSFDELGRIHIAIEIDGQQYDALFDSGSDVAVLDSILFQRFCPESVENRELLHYVSKDSRVSAIPVNQDIDVLWGTDTLRYSRFVLTDVKGAMNADAILPFPSFDSHIWHFDYQNQRISRADTLPSNIKKKGAFQSTIKVQRNTLFITMPFLLRGESGDTLSCSISGAFDTGSGGYLTAHGGLLPIEDSRARSLLSKQPKHYLIDRNDYLVFIDNVSPFQGKLRITVVEDSSTAILLFGNAVLSHYDIWVDFTQMKLLGFIIDQPAHPFQEYCDSTGSSVYLTPTKDGLAVDYCNPHSICWDAGLHQGDIIVSVDDKNHRMVRREDIFKFDENNPEHCVTIVRGKERQDLIVKPSE